MDSDLTFVRCILCVELKAFFQTSFPSPSILHWCKISCSVPTHKVETRY